MECETSGEREVQIRLRVVSKGKAWNASQINDYGSEVGRNEDHHKGNGS